MAGTLSRRQALAAGAAGVAAVVAGGAGLVQAGVLPGRYRMGRLLGACDLGEPPPTTVAPGPLRFASLPSRHRGRPVRYGVAWPPGSGPGDRLGVCLLLHAAAGDERAPFERLRLHYHLAQAAGPPDPPGDHPGGSPDPADRPGDHPGGPPDPPGRVRPFALASADGRGSGWRPAPGDDPFAMLLDELLPVLSGLGLRTGPGQVAVLGWSMGGGGALRLAETHPGRLAALVAASPAVDPAGAEVRDAGRLTGLPVKVDCGANDPFADATRALATALPSAEVAVTKGCHNGSFWQHQAPAQLRFVAAALGP